MLKKTSKQNRKRKDLLSKKTSDVHAFDEISSISPKNLTSHFKYYCHITIMTKVSPQKENKCFFFLIPDIDHCINATCKNGGSCVDGFRNYSCVCLAGFMGDQCQTGILDFIFKLALTNLMWSYKVILKQYKFLQFL